MKTFLQSEDMSGKTVHLIVTHGGSGKGRSVEDVKELTSAEVSDNVLTIYDDDVTQASGTVGEWLSVIFPSLTVDRQQNSHQPFVYKACGCFVFRTNMC